VAAGAGAQTSASLEPEVGEGANMHDVTSRIFGATQKCELFKIFLVVCVAYSR
jgi:hypothetical protein